MADFFFALGQLICSAALICGLYLTITNWRHSEPVEHHHNQISSGDLPRDQDLTILVVPTQSVIGAEGRVQAGAQRC